jgi:peptide/nickel transport system substrate-binding protein
MKISRRTALQGTAGAFALGLGGFNFDFTKAHAQAPAVKRGGTLNFAISAEAPHYDPHGSDTYATLHLAGPFYSTLMRFNLSKFPAIEGDLAQSWTVAPDLMTYTFKLHPNVKFADGTALTSADVRATYDRLRNPPQGVVSTRKATFEDIDTIETPDPLTVVFKMKAVNASMLEQFASPWNVIYTAKDLAENPAGPRTKINGTGPFIFVEHIKGSHVAGKKNDNCAKKGLPSRRRRHLHAAAAAMPRSRAGGVRGLRRRPA